MTQPAKWQPPAQNCPSSANQYPVNALLSHEGNLTYRIPPYQRISEDHFVTAVDRLTSFFVLRNLTGYPQTAVGVEGRAGRAHMRTIPVGPRVAG